MLWLVRITWPETYSACKTSFQKTTNSSPRLGCCQLSLESSKSSSVIRRRSAESQTERLSFQSQRPRHRDVVFSLLETLRTSTRMSTTSSRDTCTSPSWSTNWNLTCVFMCYWAELTHLESSSTRKVSVVWPLASIDHLIRTIWTTCTCIWLTMQSTSLQATTSKTKEARKMTSVTNEVWLLRSNTLIRWALIQQKSCLTSKRQS